MEILSPNIKIETHREAAECKADITPPSLHTKYTFIREIGHGTQGRIYLAKRNEDGVKVAIKQLNIESVKTWKAYDLFKREASVLQSLNIPGVAKFYEAIECLDDDPPCSYIVQEYIQGQSLADMIKAGHRFALNRVYDIILQLLKILNQLQKHYPPIVHRDIKPSNILLKPLGGDVFKVYLIDFGAVANPQIQSGGSTVAGTFGYMAPEQMMGKPEPASDIYSLGAVAVHLISGKSPADMPVKDFHLIFEPDLQNMPPALIAALRRMLAPNVSERLCNIDVLSKLFKVFSGSIYSSQTHFNVESQSNDEFEKRLTQVEFYGQDGNIELWQRLPDETPRKIPLNIQSIQFKKDEEPYDFEHYSLDGKKEEDTWETVKIILTMREGFIFSLCLFGLTLFLSWLFLLLILVLILTIIEIFVVIPGIRNTFFSSHSPDMLLSFLNNSQNFLFPHNLSQAIPVHLTILLVFWLLFIFIAYLKHSSRQKTISNKLKQMIFPIKTMSIKENRVLQDAKCNAELPLPNLLLSYGRKTIATIVQIQYFPTLEQNVEAIESEHFRNPKLAAHYSCHGKPNIAISYKFNPPDDAREEDILHTIITHTDVFSHLKIGDPLPILYWIERSKLNVEKYVASMPFPYPLEDPLQITDLICSDNAFRPDKSNQDLFDICQKVEKPTQTCSNSELDTLFKELLK